MARMARIVLPGLPHHVTHRGNRRTPIFLEDADCESYLRRLRRYGADCGLDIWSYCLMTNHIHLLAVPCAQTSLGRAIGRTHMMHAKALNRREGWSGHLWSNRFYSAPVDPASAALVARYIELNPVRAGLCRRAADYPWSSARSHCTGARDPLLAEDRPFVGDLAAWSSWLDQGLLESTVEEVRHATSTGTPIGSKGFLGEIERRLGRRLRRRGYRREKRDRYK